MNRKYRNLAAGALLGLTLLGGSAAASGADSSSGTQRQVAGQARMEARFSQLSDAQRQCLSDAGLSRPTSKPTAEQFQALRSAASDCGIQIGGPSRGSVAQHPQSPADGQGRKQARFSQLSDAQRQCLSDAGLSRPTSKPTAEQFQALRSAATDCGIAVPNRGSN